MTRYSIIRKAGLASLVFLAGAFFLAKNFRVSLVPLARDAVPVGAKVSPASNPVPEAILGRTMSRTERFSTPAPLRGLDGAETAAALFIARLARSQPELNLSAQETLLLTEIYLDMLHLKNTYEAGLIEELKFDGNSAVLRIPPYETVGKEFRDLFYGSLAKAFPAPRTVEIEQTLGSALDWEFAGFGTAEQTFEIQRANAPLNAVLVIRTTRMQAGRASTQSTAENPSSGSISISGVFPIEKLQESQFGSVYAYAHGKY